MTHQKTVLVTGCSEGGIGAALVAEFARRGCRVFATARNPDKLEFLTKEQHLAQGGSITPLQLDVTSDTSIAECVAAVDQALSSRAGETEGEGEAQGLDILVNNAGINHIMPFADASVSDLRRVIDTNVVGAFAVTHGFLPLLMRASKSKRSQGKSGGGAVVASVGSVNEIFHPPYQAAYSASKAAVHAMARSLRVELAPLGVRFVTLVTGSVRTRLFENAPTVLPEGSAYAPLKEDIEGRSFLKNARFIDPEEYAREVVAGLLRDQPKRNIWAGGMSTVAWLLSWLGWEGMMVSFSTSYLQNGVHDDYGRHGLMNRYRTRL